MKYKIERKFENNLIIVGAALDERYKLRMVIDTGATNTTIDNNALYLCDYNFLVR